MSEELHARISRLERRLERERQARVDAEKIAEDGLRELYDVNQALDERVTARTRELEIARANAVAANEAKSQFLAHISHEVHTPINGVLGMLELLDASTQGDTERSWLRSASTSVERLQRLFVRLLAHLELESVDLAAVAEPKAVAEILDELAARWRTRAAAAGKLLMVDLEDPALVVGHTPQLELGVEELLANAIDHADPGVVQLRASRDLLGRVRIGVADEGPGIADDLRTADRLLEPGAVTTRTAEGLGIGLAFARRIAQCHRGTLVLEANPAGGTTAWLTVGEAAGQASR
ncbi:MAG: HAMP domain-containing sensor histidine kinase [Actinomycetota bacterium]